MRITFADRPEKIVRTFEVTTLVADAIESLVLAVQPERDLELRDAESLKERNTQLLARIAELEEFLSACRYAGPDGVEQLRAEAQRLLSKKAQN